MVAGVDRADAVPVSRTYTRRKCEGAVYATALLRQSRAVTVAVGTQQRRNTCTRLGRGRKQQRRPLHDSVVGDDQAAPGRERTSADLGDGRRTILRIAGHSRCDDSEAVRTNPTELDRGLAGEGVDLGGALLVAGDDPPMGHSGQRFVRRAKAPSLFPTAARGEAQPRPTVPGSVGSTTTASRCVRRRRTPRRGGVGAEGADHVRERLRRRGVEVPDGCRRSACNPREPGLPG